jgi:hypothetical protein
MTAALDDGGRFLGTTPASKFRGRYFGLKSVSSCPLTFLIRLGPHHAKLQIWSPISPIAQVGLKYRAPQARQKAQDEEFSGN